VVAEEACQRVRRKTIAQLQRMTDILLTGDESELHNAWDAICVEIQVGRSDLWDAYDGAVRSTMAKHVSELRRFERKAIWLQTLEGQRRVRNSNDALRPPLDVNGAIVDYIANYFVYWEAYRWINPRIRPIVERHIWG
jgi:hypothetical protein